METNDNLESVLYYLIEKTNKVIRRYSQERLIEAGLDLTVDQWLVMKKISDVERITQVELANSIFKDTASITRILELLQNKGMIEKEIGSDKRANALKLTASGKKYVQQAYVVIKTIRKKGIEQLPKKDVAALRKSLNKIIENLS